MPKVEMIFKTYSDYVEVKVPITSQGKFRCKTRNDFQEYGKIYAPKSKPIPNNAYIEWQIGYDKELNNKDKTTSLTNLIFDGSNKTKKNPYELSEILYEMCKIKIISKTEINDLIKQITNINNYIHDLYPIELKKENIINLNKKSFYKSYIALPTFNLLDKSSQIVIQISKEKQQNASSIQPMLYINIPVLEFNNKDKLIGNTSEEEKYGILKIDKNKVELIKNIFICFGMCSKSHHHDVLEILKLIRENI